MGSVVFKVSCFNSAQKISVFEHQNKLCTDGGQFLSHHLLTFDANLIGLFPQAEQTQDRKKIVNRPSPALFQLPAEIFQRASVCTTLQQSPAKSRNAGS